MESIKLQNVVSEMVPPNTTTELGYRLTVSSSAVSLLAADIGASAKYVMLQVQGAAVYCTYDGTTPSATNGIYVNVFEKTVTQRALALRMKFIRVTAADGYVMAQPFNSLAA
jgi:hypothetical protein